MITKHVQICIFLCADPLQVNWLADGCKTHQEGAQHTECLCNHLTYFSILVVRNTADTLPFYEQETNIGRGKKARQWITQKYIMSYVLTYKALLLCSLLCSLLCLPHDSNWSLAQCATSWLWPALRLWVVLCHLSAVSRSSFISAWSGNNTVNNTTVVCLQRQVVLNSDATSDI